jgi:hypothetical protein
MAGAFQAAAAAANRSASGTSPPAASRSVKAVEDVAGPKRIDGFDPKGEVAHGKADAEDARCDP